MKTQIHSSVALFALPVALLAAAAQAQLSVGWHTIDGGGGASAGGGFALQGTIGQHDAGTMAGGAFSLQGGFWAGDNGHCPADLDDGSGNGSHDGAVTIDDLLYFLTGFESGSASVDLDNDGDPALGTPDGAVTIDDLLFFLARFEAGC